MSRPDDPGDAAAGTPSGRVRGSAIVHVVKALRIRRDRTPRVLTESLRRYLSEPIDLLGWYPEEDAFALLHALVEIATPREGLWEWLGAQTAARDLVELHPSLLRPGDALGTLGQLDTLWQLAHDTGRIQILREPGGAVRVELRDFVHGGEGFARLMRGYLVEVLRLAGATDGEVTMVHLGDRERPWRWRLRCSALGSGGGQTPQQP